MQLPEPEPQAAHRAHVSIFVVIVLYKMLPSASPAYTSFMHELEGLGPEVRVSVLLYDNTREDKSGDFPENVHYVASAHNSGLATAYNVALDRATQAGFTWLLTLDQDTFLPAGSLRRYVELAGEQQLDARVAAVVPQLFTGELMLSPQTRNWLTGSNLPRAYEGLPGKPVYGFNSGAMFRVEVLTLLGGYSLYFWLDQSDSYIFRRVNLAGYEIFVAGSIALQHDLSFMFIEQKMSLGRYRDVLEYSSAFADTEQTRVYAIMWTLRLVRLALAQMYRKASPAVRGITVGELRRRLTRSKKSRVAQWLAEQQTRIAGHTVPPDG